MQISQIYYIEYAVTKLSKYMQYSRSVIFKLYLLTYCTNPPVSSYLESDWKTLALGSLCWVPIYEEVSAELIKSLEMNFVGKYGFISFYSDFLKCIKMAHYK